MQLACALLLAAAPLQAQSADTEVEAMEQTPLLEALEVRGVDSVSESELRESLATRPTSCRSIVLTPFCKLPLTEDVSAFTVKRYLDREEFRLDQLRARVFYWRRGYRDVQVSAAVEPAGDGVRAVLEVEEGPATRIRSLSVRQLDPVLTERRLAQVGLPEEGTPVDVIQLDSATARIQRLLHDEGYADAQVRDTIRGVDSLAVAVEVVVEPNRRSTVGPLVIRGNREVSDRTIRRMIGLDSGQVFRQQDVVQAQRRLYRSELFRQTLVDVPEQADSSKRVVVTVQEAPFRGVRAGIGFNTLDFVQAEAGYTLYNWMGGARRLDVSAGVGNLLAQQLHDRGLFNGAFEEFGEVDDAFLRPTWRASAEVTEPFFGNHRNALSYGVFAHRRSIPGIVVDRGYGASAAFTRRLMEDLPLSATYRYESTSVEATGVYYCLNFGVCRDATIDALRDPYALSPLGLTAQWVRTNDPLAPTSGFSVQLDLEHASSYTLSDFRYNRVSGEAVRYLELGAGVLAGRVHTGWVRPLESTVDAVRAAEAELGILHPRKRFYSGGSRSVRGYGENQLGPRILTIPSHELTNPDDPARAEDACTIASIRARTCDPGVAVSDAFQPRPLGGNALLEANLEYRFPLFWEIGGAVFLDAGYVGDRDVNIPTGARFAATPGFGFRYLTVVGPVRLDLGIKPTLAETLPVITEVDGELVQLQLEKEYDPLEGSGGFVRQVLNRLQLHLSIGEAF